MCNVMSHAGSKAEEIDVSEKIDFDAVSNSRFSKIPENYRLKCII